MSIFVIGDAETVLGFQLVGICGKVAHGADETREELEKALQDENVQLLFITCEWAEEVREKVDRLKMTSLRPIVMEIPGKQGEPPGQSLNELVNRAIGVSI